MDVVALAEAAVRWCKSLSFFIAFDMIAASQVAAL